MQLRLLATAHSRAELYAIILKDGGVLIFLLKIQNLEPEIVKAVQEANKIIAGEVKVPEEPVTKKDDKRVK